LIAGHTPRFPPVPYWRPVTLLLFAAVLSAAALPTNRQIQLAYAVETATLCTLVVMYAVVVHHLRSHPGALQGVLTATVVGLSLSEVAGVLGAWDLISGRGTASPFVYEGVRVVGTFLNPNALASFFLFGLFITAGLWLSDVRLTPWPRWLLLGCFLLGSLVLIGAGSRGGYVSFAAGAVTLFVLGTGVRRRVCALILFLVVGGTAAVALAASHAGASVQYLTSAVTAFSNLSTDPELQGRLTIWREVWPVIQTHPVVGAGFGTFRFVTEAELGLEGGAEAHNTPLGIWAEIGPLGLLAILWLTAAVIRDLMRAYRASRGTPTRGLVLGLTAAAVALAVDSLSQNIQRHRHLWVLLALIAVLTQAYRDASAMKTSAPSTS